MTQDKAALYSRVSVAAIHKVSITSSEVNTMGVTAKKGTPRECAVVVVESCYGAGEFARSAS